MRNIVPLQYKIDAGQMIWEMLERKWLAGLVFCKMFKFFQTYALASSNYMLVALAVDRHKAVTNPLAVSRSRSPYRWRVMWWGTVMSM